MLILISPAKTLDFESAPKTDKQSLPEFTQEAQTLIKQLREFAVQTLRS